MIRVVMFVYCEAQQAAMRPAGPAPMIRRSVVEGEKLGAIAGGCRVMPLGR